MALGLSAAQANALLDAMCADGTYTSPAGWFIELRTGDPGPAGLAANVAGNATRKSVSFGAASGGVKSNDAAVTWSGAEVDTAEDYTHWAAWTASTGGTFLCSGTMTANAVLVGDTFQIPVGDLDLQLTVAS